MADLSTIMKTLMSEQRLTSSELARQTGIGQPVVHRMMSGKSSNPKVKTLRPIADFFEISISQLIGDEPLSFKKAIYKEVPVLEWDSIEDYKGDRSSLVEGHEVVSTDRDVSDRAFALRIQDSTMLPRFPEDAAIIIDPAKQPENRDFVIMKLKGQKRATFKQFLIDGDDVYLKPLSNDFDTIKLTDGEFECLGVMVQTRIDYK